MDLDPDRVVGTIPGDGAAGTVVLRLQADLGGADVLAVDAGAGEGIDDRLLAVIRLVHRHGDVRRGELDADVGGQGVRDALDLAGADDRHFAWIVPDLCRVAVAGGHGADRETQCEDETERQPGAGLPFGSRERGPNRPPRALQPGPPYTGRSARTATHGCYGAALQRHRRTSPAIVKPVVPLQ